MLKSQNDSRVCITRQDLSCVWIVASAMPEAALVCIWTDTKMRAFEETETGRAEATVDSGLAEEGPGTRLQALTLCDVKHSV